MHIKSVTIEAEQPRGMSGYGRAWSLERERGRGKLGGISNVRQNAMGTIKST